MFRRFLDPFYFGGLLFDGEGGGGGSGDGGQGDGGQQGSSGGAGGEGGGGNGDRTFTQADLDRIVQDRLAKEKAKYSDYDDLKAKAAKADEYESQNASDLEKAQKAKDDAEKQRDEALQRANSTLVRAAVIAEAAKQGAVDVEAVHALLPRDAVTINDDGDVQGAEDAVKALIEAKPWLKPSPNGAPAGDADGGKGNSGGMTAEDVRKLAAENPREFTRKLQAGEIPAAALGAQ